MGGSRPNREQLGRQLAVVYPHPISVLIGCVPGAALMWITVSVLRPSGVVLLFDPEFEMARGARPFFIVSLAVAAVLLWMGLRHIFDRAVLCRDGFCFRGRAFLLDDIGPITWGHYSSAGMTRFWDETSMDFTCRGKHVRLKTRYLRDLRYHFCRVYGINPSAGGSAVISRPANTDSYTRSTRR